MHSPVVAVVRGGNTHEYDVSLNSGARTLEALEARGFRTKDIFLDRSGIWHYRGIPLTPERALMESDVVFNMIHGAYGEDGSLQRVLERLQVPYTGSRSVASAATYNKLRTKELLALHPILIPSYRVLSVSDNLQDEVLALFRSMLMPVVVKPLSGGSSLGTNVASSYAELVAAVSSAFQFDSSILVEEYIKGRELTLGVIDGFRGEELYVTPAVEVTPLGVYSYSAKQSGEIVRRAPAPLSNEDRAQVTELARTVYKLLSMSGFATVDIILSRRGPYLLEVNSVPGVGEHAPLTHALQSVGATLMDLVGHIVPDRLKK